MMKTYYLILRTGYNDKPALLKKCQAGSRVVAAIIFADRLNSFNRNNLFNYDELLKDIKTEEELTEQEKRWIKNEENELLEL